MERRGFHVRYRHGRCGDTVPEKLPAPVVTNAALDVFNNFVNTLARVTPPTTTMTESGQIRGTEVRRSARFKEGRGANSRPQLPLPTAISVPSTAKTMDQKV